MKRRERTLGMRSAMQGRAKATLYLCYCERLTGGLVKSHVGTRHVCRQAD